MKSVWMPYWEFKDDLDMWWRNANSNVRDKIIDELRKIPLPQHTVSKADCRFAVDYCDRMYELGDSCVYAWVNENCEIIYIGCGDITRATQPLNRNADFEKRYRDENVKPFILCFNVDKEIALRMETLCIWQAQIKGWKLENKSKRLKTHELMALRENQQDSKIVEKYSDMIDEFPDIVESFDALSSFCLDTVLSEKGMLEPEYLVTKSRNKKRSIRHMWTIDGVTRPAMAWCKKYNKSMGTTLERIDVYGCTPKEALTFPNLPREYYKKKSIDAYWKENNYTPGTDTTSRVTPHDEWPDEYKPYED